MANVELKSSDDVKVIPEALSDTIMEWKRPTTLFLYLVAGLLVFVSTIDTLMIKWMGYQSVITEPGGERRNMEAAFWQTLISYVLESAMIFVYLWDKAQGEKHGKKFHNEYVHLHTTSKSFNKRSCPFYFWAIPAFLDFLTSLAVNYAASFVHGSTQQLLRNFNVVVTALISLVWIRVALRVNQWLGVFLVTLGLIVNGIEELRNPEQSTNYGSLIYLGFVLAILGTLANAFQVVVEERLFRDYHVAPFEAIGFFGIFGFTFTTIAYYISELINWRGDKLSRIIYVMGQNETASRNVIISSCVLLFSISTFNLSGMIVTKLGSSLLRMIVISFRTFTVWVMELLLGWNVFQPIGFIGLMITLVGIGVYNYNYIVPTDSWKYDAMLRYPLMKGTFLQDPDVLEATEMLSDLPIKSQASRYDTTTP